MIQQVITAHKIGNEQGEKDLQNDQKKLWGGRFLQDNHTLFVRFNASLSVDWRLYHYDIKATKAFTIGLCDIGILSSVELEKIHCALAAIENQMVHSESFIQNAIDQGVEDIHTLIEQCLFDHIGELAYKVNTGRSRNEQVACVTRLYLMETIKKIQNKIQELQSALCDQAEKHLETMLMGYTHLQQAQPITWGHYFLSFFERLDKDAQRLQEIYNRVSICPLGSGALSGNAWQIDRQKMADYLGFQALSKNSLESVGDRDFIVEFLSISSLLATHLSTLAEDFIIYSSHEFGLIEMSDLVTTGSSLMPQKKNPDAMELIRGKTGSVYGQMIGLLTTLKGLPSGYNKDLQEDKKALFTTADTICDMLSIAHIVISTLIIKPVKNTDDYCLATEIADYLSKKGIAFRQAHHLVGQIVNYAIDKNKKLSDLTLDEFNYFCVQIDKDIYSCLTLQSAINAKNVAGGTAVIEVKKALTQAKKAIEDFAYSIR
ncbi:argininosuccinate lyase [Facilibium subflavum]|uniref:argininosuccinate lyase n=1 Tax=Facilibium subflavum TaxID=2219058 RepID=UPI000E6533BF|nr:argininosuccinate lyase [Facilibium subflavum]